MYFFSGMENTNHSLFLKIFKYNLREVNFHNIQLYIFLNTQYVLKFNSVPNPTAWN